MIPGVSRSAASIIGGMQQGLTRNLAAEFSFFLAVPTMLAATGYKLLKYYKETGSFSSEEIKLLAVGNIVAFIVALIAIKFFINFVKKYGFKIWGIYRIILGIRRSYSLKIENSSDVIVYSASEFWQDSLERKRDKILVRKQPEQKRVD